MGRGAKNVTTAEPELVAYVFAHPDDIAAPL